MPSPSNSSERRVEATQIASTSGLGAQSFDPRGAVGLLADGRNQPRSETNLAGIGMASNSELLGQLQLQMRDLGGKIGLDANSYKSAFSHGKEQAFDVKTHHSSERDGSLKEHLAREGVIKTFKEDFRQVRENTHQEVHQLHDMQRFARNLQQTDTNVTARVADNQTQARPEAQKSPTDSQATQKGRATDQNSVKTALTKTDALTNTGKLDTLAIAQALDSNFRSAHEKGHQPEQHRGQAANQNEKQQLTARQDVGQQHQLDSLNSGARDGSQLNAFNAYVSMLAGSIIDKLNPSSDKNSDAQNQARMKDEMKDASGNRLDRTNENSADRRLAQLPEQMREQAKRSMDDADRAQRVKETQQGQAVDRLVKDNRPGEVNNNDRREQLKNIDVRQDQSRQNDSRSQARPESINLVVGDQSKMSDSANRVVEDLSELITQLGGDSTKEKSSLHPLLKIKMLMKLRFEMMKKFKMLWKAKNKLFEKLQKKLDKTKVRAGQNAKRRRTAIRKAEAQQGERRVAETRKSQREKREVEPQRRRVGGRDVVERPDQRMVRTEQRARESNVWSLDAVRTMRKLATTRSEAPPQHHVTEVACVGKPGSVTKQSLFGPMNCGNPTGVKVVPQLTDGTYGLSTTVTTSARRA